MLGRLEHQQLGSQQIADPERVARAAAVLPEVHCELRAGDVLFFHGNTLHASDPNRSGGGGDGGVGGDGGTSRWSVVYSYAAEANPVVVAEDPTVPIADGGLTDGEVEAAVRRHEARLYASDSVEARL